LPIEKAGVQGKIIIGTVEGDVHDIGKNLVAMFEEGAGFEVHNLGRDVPTSEFVAKARELEPHIVGLSAMMSTSMEKMGEVIEEFEKNGLRDRVAFMIGGAAVTEEFAKEIGADGYAEDATKAVRLCERLMRERK
jgi:methylmalonyl-CoA mutase cobalamin-binding domain/chain